MQIKANGLFYCVYWLILLSFALIFFWYIKSAAKVLGHIVHSFLGINSKLQCGQGFHVLFNGGNRVIKIFLFLFV